METILKATPQEVISFVFLIQRYLQSPPKCTPLDERLPVFSQREILKWFVFVPQMFVFTSLSAGFSNSYVCVLLLSRTTCFCFSIYI